MSLSIARLRATASARGHRYYSAPGSSVRWGFFDWVLAIGGEAGEACNVVKKLNRARLGMAGNVEDRDALLLRLGGEIADVLIYAAIFADQYGHRLPWDDFHALRREARQQHDPEARGSLSVLGCQLLYWAARMGDTEETIARSEMFLERLWLAAGQLADAAGIDLGAAVIATFNATSDKLGFPERL